MTRDYHPFAMLETTFILSDPRYRQLPASAKTAYVAVWCRAFHERRELLPTWYDRVSWAYDACIDARTLSKVAAILQQRCLIKIYPDNRIRVCGVRNKGKIKWKDAGQDFDQDYAKNGAYKNKSKSKKIVLNAVDSTDRESCTVPVDEEKTKTLVALGELEAEFVKLWNVMASACGFQALRGIGKVLKPSFAARASDAYWRENWRRALDEIPKSPLLTGNDRWTPNAEWFLRPKTVYHLVEGGKYGNLSQSRPRAQTTDPLSRALLEDEQRRAAEAAGGKA